MKKYIYLLLFILAATVATVLAAEKLDKVSGDNQSGIEGYPLREDFVVHVAAEGTGMPLNGVPVSFTIVSQCGRNSNKAQTIEPSLSSPVSVTDAGGFARTRLNLGSPYTGEVFVSASSRGSIGAPAVFTAESKAKNWGVVLLLEITGGLGIFLFGMFFLNDAIGKMAGHRLRDVLIRLTGSPLRGMTTGVFVTLFNQSSSATTLLEVSLVSAGLLTFYQTMAVTMGAELGSTVTAQLVAFRLSDFAVILAGAGFYVSFFGKTKKIKNLGNALLGFGMLFLGMKIMTDLLMPMRSYGPFLDLMKSAENPILGILAGMAFTMLVHSSGATSGIVIALALAGAISIEQAIPLNLGAQIGTCVTAALGSIGRGREGKRVALWHVFHQSAGVLLVLPFLTIFRCNGEASWIYFIKWFTRTVFYTMDPARQIAMAHTLASAFNAMVFFPLLPFLKKALCSVYPPVEEEKPFGPMYIDDGLINTPSLALEQARKEIVREARIVQEMIDDTLRVFDSRDLKLSETVSLKDFRADVLRNAVVPYLTKLAQNSVLSEEQSAQEIKLLYIAAFIESIGDIIDKNIMPLARKKLENKLWFSNDGWKEIVDLHSRVAGNLRRVTAALENNDLELSRLVEATKPEIDGYEAELRKRHIGRINAGLQESLETSSVHLDLIEQFKRINSLVTSVANTILGRIR